MYQLCAILKLIFTPNRSHEEVRSGHPLVCVCDIQNLTTKQSIFKDMVNLVKQSRCKKGCSFLPGVLDEGPLCNASLHPDLHPCRNFITPPTVWSSSHYKYLMLLWMGVDQSSKPIQMLKWAKCALKSENNGS